MKSEDPLVLNSIDLMWLFSVDLLNPIEDMKSTIDKLCECEFCEAFLRYKTSKEPGDRDIKIKKNVEDTEKYKEFLNLLCKSDFYTLDIEYLENLSFARFLLKSIKVKFPFSEEFHQCKILLTVSNLGIAVITLWVHIEQDLNSEQIAKLQILPTEDLMPVLFEVPVEILKEVARISVRYKKLYNRTLAKDKKSRLFKYLTFAALIDMLWYSLINVLNDREYKSLTLDKFHSLIKKDMRHDTFYIFPLVIVHSTNPKYEYIDKILDIYPKQFYQILSHIHKFNYNLTNSTVIDEVLKPDITERRDIAYLDALGSALLIFGSENKNDLEKKSIIFEVFIIIEILQIQRIYLGFLTKYLAQPIASYSPRKISIVESYLSKALDFHYCRVTKNDLARKRLDHGKDIMEINEQFMMVEKKIDLLRKAANNFTSIKSSTFQIALALVIGIAPFFYYLSPFNNRILDALYAICITIGIVILITPISRKYWNYLRQKKLK